MKAKGKESKRKSNQSKTHRFWQYSGRGFGIKVGVNSFSLKEQTNIYFTFHFIFNLQYFQIMINYLCLIAYTHTLLTLYINKNKYTHTHTCQATDDIDFGSLHVVLMPQLTLRISACIFGGSSLLLEHKFNVSLRERYSRAHWKNSNSGIEAHWKLILCEMWSS